MLNKIELLIGNFFLWSHRKMPNWFNILFDYIVYFRKKIIGFQEIKNDLCINIEGFQDYNIRISSFNEKKILGISGICRVKNGDDFLEPVILSYLELCDEVIIINNNSSDKTGEIGKKLTLTYPNKIKYFDYPFDTITLQTKDFGTIKSNSVYSFAYASNYALSLANYKYIIKVDDDNLLIPSRAKEFRNLVLKENLDKYYNYWGINLLLENGKIGVSKAYNYSGLGDHGLFPLSNKTFFIQGSTNECLIHPYLWKRFGDLFIHLKLLKKDMGWTNYTSEKKSYYNNWIKSGGIDYNIDQYLDNITKKNIIDTLNVYGITKNLI